MTRLLSLSTLVVAALLPGMARAAQAYDNCTGFIDSLPATIATQGTWCLRMDLATSITSGAAISIETNNVTLDCNQFKVGGLRGGIGTLAVGIQATLRDNTTVRQCSVRGFATGIYLNGDGSLVEDNRLDANTYRGIVAAGYGTVIRGNRVLDTGGSSARANWAIGIRGFGSDILDNTVAGVMPVGQGGWGNAIGIQSESGLGSSITGNRVRRVTGTGDGSSVAIASVDSSATLARNEVTGSGLAGAIAFECHGPKGRLLDNTVVGMPTLHSGCIDLGNHNYPAP